MIISSIVPADKRRSKVFLDGSFAFVLYNGEIRRFHMEEGQELSQESYEEIVGGILCRRARERMLHMLKASSRTEAEIRRKLKDALYPPRAVEEAVAFARRYHYIDDEDYARRYFEIYGEKKSLRQLTEKLRQKGISREITEEAVRMFPADEEAKALEILRKRHYDPAQADLKEKRRMAAFLARRGFTGDVIGRVMGRMSESDDFL